MISTENFIRPGSDFYVYTPGAQAKRLFLYPMIVGNFTYLPGYNIRRNAFDSFLLMYLKKGECTVETAGHVYHAKEGNVIFLDCYAPHAYGTGSGCSIEWIHFDGISARGYFEAITEATGPIISLQNSYRFEKYLHRIYLGFRDTVAVGEPLLNNYLVNIMTELFLAKSHDVAEASASGIIEDTVAYISDHIHEELSLEQLASQASLSTFYFSRLFKRETGFSPHEYVIETRVNAAKFFLQNEKTSIKDICYSCGFSSESSFCTTFKKVTGMTPSKYRSAVNSLQDSDETDKTS
ncbi:AraC family transcriptional regulator [Oribacterium sp. C9]|uniref:AraC family transcriptional regulator n=1 Tax=Oribacterium sp. C9 TaxID=1943579 RepID=UPI00098FC082|nr:AraC family transcriptional regulator [Oribacterium sp. C9]OON86879.1 AraC family transcriptional regulator [Oribacterium sp. C9]